ncbi:MAG: exodeoxyribonuclease VII large subunit [bacterium]|nr:exodeoxyribonuclease VII large subunit [bacterium]
MSFTLVGIDPAFTLGQLEARRRETLTALQAAGLMERNAGLSFPVLPLRVGLVTSVGSAAEKDFLAGLAAAGYGFTVLRADCRMMGEQMVGQVTGALRALGAAGVDAIVVTRGGGSKADLSWFDHRDVAEAVARCPVPVVTAIGHEIDLSLADLVAHHHCKTPTAAAQDLVDRIAAADQRLRRAADGAALQAARILGDSRRDLTGAAAALGAAVVTQVRGRHERLVHLRGAALGAARRRLERAGERAARVGLALEPQRLLASWPRRRSDLERATDRLERATGAVLAVRRARLDHLAQKAQWLDPARQLRRGWSLTLDVHGRLLRDAAAVAPGDRLVTRLQSGQIVSIVESAGDAGRD